MKTYINNLEGCVPKFKINCDFYLIKKVQIELIAYSVKTQKQEYERKNGFLQQKIQCIYHYIVCRYLIRDYFHYIRIVFTHKSYKRISHSFCTSHLLYHFLTHFLLMFDILLRNPAC
jgi:hypothetical protein